MGSGKPAAEPWHASEEPNKRRSNPPRDWPVLAFCPCASMVWWLQRGAHTRSHPELGRENPQRRWYCVLRRGRVGRRQTFQAQGQRSGAKVRARKGSMVEHLAMTDESQGRPLPPFVSNPGAHPPPDPGGPGIAQGRNDAGWGSPPGGWTEGPKPIDKERHPDGPHSEGIDAGWSSPVARQAHNLKVVGSNPTPATIIDVIPEFLLCDARFRIDLRPLNSSSFK